MIELKTIQNEQDKGQIIQDKKNAFIKMVFTPNRDVDMRLNMYDPFIWKGFPLAERFWYNFCCKSSICSDLKHNQFHIDEILANPCTLDKKIDFINRIVSLTILKTGTLEIEPTIVHP